MERGEKKREGRVEKGTRGGKNRGNEKEKAQITMIQSLYTLESEKSKSS